MKSPTLFALLLTTSTCACTMSNNALGDNTANPQAPVPNFQAVQSTGYIVTARHASAIRHHYARYGIRLLRDLGAQHFEVQLDTDPGLLKLQEIAAETKGEITTIQVNQTYLSF